MHNSTPVNYNETRAAFGPPRINPDQSLNISAIESSRNNRGGSSRHSSRDQDCIVACAEEAFKLHVSQASPGVRSTERPQNRNYLGVPNRRKEVRIDGDFARTPPRPFYQPQIEQMRSSSPGFQSPFLPQQNRGRLRVPSRGKEYNRTGNRNISPPRPARYHPDRFANSHHYGNGANQFTDSHFNYSNLSDPTYYMEMENGLAERQQQELNELRNANIQTGTCSGRASEPRNNEHNLLVAQNADMHELQRATQLTNLRKYQFNKRILELVSHGPCSHSSKTTIEESNENNEEHLNNFRKFSDVVISRMLKKHVEQILEVQRDSELESNEENGENQLMEGLKAKHGEELESLAKDLAERFHLYMENLQNPVIEITETTTTGPNNEVITERVTTEGGNENEDDAQIIRIENESPEDSSNNLSIGTAVTYVLNKQHQTVRDIQLEINEAMKHPDNNEVKVRLENKLNQVILSYRGILMEILSSMQEVYNKQLVDAGIMELPNGTNPCATNQCGSIHSAQNQSQRSNISQNQIEFGPANQTNRSNVSQSGVHYGPLNQTQRSNDNRSGVLYGPINQTQSSIRNQSGIEHGPLNQSPCADISQNEPEYGPANQSPCSIVNQSGIQYGPPNQTQRSSVNETIEYGPENGSVRSKRTTRSQTIVEYGPENQTQHSNMNQSLNSGINQSRFGNSAAANTSRMNQSGVEFGPANQSQRSINQSGGAHSARSIRTSPVQQCPQQCGNTSEMQREEYASFRSCLTALFEKQHALINSVKEKQLLEQQNNPGQLLKEKHDLEMKLVNDHNLREFNEIWQMIIQINPSVLRKLPPISIPPQIEQNARSIVDNVENSQSLSDSANEDIPQGQCSPVGNERRRKKVEVVDGMYFHSMPMEGDSAVERSGNNTMNRLLHGGHLFPEARASFHGNKAGPLKTPDKRNAVSMDVSYEKEFKTRAEIFTDTPLIDRDYVMSPNFVRPVFSTAKNTPNMSNTNQTNNGTNGGNLSTSRVNSCAGRSTSRANMNNARASGMCTVSSNSIIAPGSASSNRVGMINASTAPSASRANTSCISNSNSMAAPGNTSPANMRNVSQTSRLMVNASTTPSASLVNTSCPAVSNSSIRPDTPPPNNIVTTTVITKRTQRGSDQALTESSETVTTSGPANATSLIATGAGNCSCNSGRSSNNKLTSMNGCPCLSMLPTVTELDELEETEKCELNRCLRRWQLCRRDIVSQMSQKR